MAIAYSGHTILHMIIGDTPELPASSVTKWGGPLKLEAL
jgi:hypothetical protein